MNKISINFLQSELTRIIDLTKFADFKAGFLFTVLTLLINLWQKTLINYNFTMINMIMDSIILIVVIAALITIFFTVSPRNKNQNTSKSVCFFGTIAEMKIIDFQKCYNNLNDDEIKEQIKEQIHTNSIILSKKMKWIKYGYIFLMATIILILVRMIVHIFI